MNNLGEVMGYNKEIQITELKPHQEGQINGLTFIMKVPGGFIYTFYSDSIDGQFLETSTFVPASDNVLEAFTCKIWEER